MVLALGVVLSVAVVETASAAMRYESGRGRRVVPGGYGRTIHTERSAPVVIEGKRVLEVRTWRFVLPLARRAR